MDTSSQALTGRALFCRPKSPMIRHSCTAKKKSAGFYFRRKRTCSADGHARDDVGRFGIERKSQNFSGVLSCYLRVVILCSMKLAQNTLARNFRLLVSEHFAPNLDAEPACQRNSLARADRLLIPNTLEAQTVKFEKFGPGTSSCDEVKSCIDKI